MHENLDLWFAANVLCDPIAIEAVESAFNLLGSIGTSVDGLRKKEDEPLVVTGYFEIMPSEREVRAAIDAAVETYGHSNRLVSKITFCNVEKADWLAEWKKYWRPSVVGRFIIAPPWLHVVSDGRHVVRIEPSMAFGTGTHETTQLCLAAIDKLFRPGDSLLDVGTGTGVLAIAAAMLGCTNVTAFDVDADSVTIARENAVLNGVTDRIKFVEGSIGDFTAPHDFVCANLTLDIIKPLLRLLISKSRKTLLLSGILAIQLDAIIADLRSRNLHTFEVTHAGEWISVIVPADQISLAEAQ